MRTRILAILTAAAVALILARPPSPPSAGGRGARLVRVIDGDTIEVEAGGRRLTVRLLGIDTPETHRPGTPVECGGPQATAALAALAPAGSQVTLEPDPGQDQVDRYGRTLAYVRLEDGRLAEDAQLRAGWAAAYVYGGRPVARHAEFARAAAAARRARAGVFDLCQGEFHSARR